MKKYNIAFLESRGFVFKKKGHNYFSENKNCSLLYREFENINEYNLVRKNLAESYFVEIFWFYIKKQNKIIVQRISGENNLFLFQPSSSFAEKFKHDTEKILDNIAEDSIINLFYSDNVYKILFKDFWHYITELSHLFYKNKAFTLKESIILAQYSFLTLFFLLFLSPNLFEQRKDRAKICNSSLLSILADDLNSSKFITEVIFSPKINFNTDFQLVNENFVLNKHNYVLLKFFTNNYVKSEYLELFESLINNKELISELEKFKWNNLCKNLSHFSWIYGPLPELSENEIESNYGNISPYVFSYFYEHFIQPVISSDESGFNVISRTGLSDQIMYSKRVKGTFYTPIKITRDICNKAISEFCEEKKALIKSKPLEIREKDDQLVKYLKEISILDPAAGTGNFILEAAISLFERIAIIDRDLITENYIHDLKHSIIENNIFGTDISKSSTDICKLRLLLWENANFSASFPLDFSFDNIEVGNSLIGYCSMPEYNNLSDINKETQDLFKKIKLGLQNDHFSELKVNFEVVLAKNSIDMELFFKSYQELKYFVRTRKLPQKFRYFEAYLEIKEFYNKILTDLYLMDLDKQFNINFKEINSSKPFHWFLEFFKIKKTGGFDLIVGNPPFISYYASKTGKKVINEDLRKVLLSNFEFIENPKIFRQRIGSSMFFLERSVKLLKETYGTLVFILDMNIYVEAYAKIRKYLLLNTQINYIVQDLQEFEVNSSQILLSLKKKKPKKNHEITFYDSNYLQIGKKLQKKITEETKYQFEYEDPIVMKMFTKFDSFENNFKVVVGYNTAGAKEFFTEKLVRMAKPYVKGGNNIQKWELVYPSQKQEKNAQLYLIYDPLLIKRVTAQHKATNKGLPGFGNKEEIFAQNKIFMRQSGDELVATIDKKGFRATHSIFMIIPKKDCPKKISLKIALASINSAIQTYYARKRHLLHAGPGKIPQITTNSTRKLLYIEPYYPEVVNWLVEDILSKNSLKNTDKEKLFLIELLELCMLESSLTEKNCFQSFLKDKIMKNKSLEKKLSKKELIQEKGFKTAISHIQNSELVLNVILWTKNNIKNKKDYLSSFF